MMMMVMIMIMMMMMMVMIMMSQTGAQRAATQHAVSRPPHEAVGKLLEPFLFVCLFVCRRR